MKGSWVLIFWTVCGLLMKVHGQVEGIEGLEGLDDDDDEDYDDTSERQFGGAMRDAVKNFVTGTVKYITNTRLIPSVVSQALRRPLMSHFSSSSTSSSPSDSNSSSGSSSDAASLSLPSSGSSSDSSYSSQASSNSGSASSSPTGNMLASASSPMATLAQLNSLLPLSSASNQIQQASEFIGNVFRTMRSNWARRNQEQQQEIKKRLAQITKRLTGSKVLMGTLHRLTGREDRSDMKTSESSSKRILTSQGIPQFIPVPYLMQAL